MAKPKLIKLDGRTGEGGGQLVRVAVALAALTGTPIQIDNVRGNRCRGKSKRGGGKSGFSVAINCSLGQGSKLSMSAASNA